MLSMVALNWNPATGFHHVTIMLNGKPSIKFTSDSADVAWTRMTYVVMHLELIDFPPWIGCTPDDHLLDGTE